MRAIDIHNRTTFNNTHFRVWLNPAYVVAVEIHTSLRRVVRIGTKQKRVALIESIHLIGDDLFLRFRPPR